MMKKIALAVIILLVSAISGFSQENAFHNGVKVAQAGVGFGFYGMYHDPVLPTFHAAFEVGVVFAPKAPISFGGVLGYARSEYHQRVNDPNPRTIDHTWNYFSVGFRSAYHFSAFIPVRKLDVYAGVMLGWTVVDYDSDDEYPSQKHANYFMHGVYGGARYYFTDMIGVFAEAGYGIGYITGGVCVKF